MEKPDVQHAALSQDCYTCRANLPAFLARTLAQPARQAVADHLAGCEACLEVYVTRIDEQDEPLSLYIGSRPLWGPLAWGAEEDEDYCHNLHALACSREESGGAVVVKHHPLQEKSLFLLFCVFSARLKRAGKPVVFADPAETDCLLPLLETAGRNKTAYILAPWSGQANDFDSFLQALALHNRQEHKIVAVLGAGTAYGKEEQIPEGAVAPEVYTLPLPDRDHQEARLSGRLGEELKRVKDRLAPAEPRIRDAYTTVALCDAYGVSVPFRLLARRLDMTADQAVGLVNQAADLLYWVGNNGQQKKERLTTAAPALARAMLPPSDTWEDAYAGLITAATKTEFDTLLCVLRQLCQKGKLTLVRSLLTRCGTEFSSLLSDASAQQHVVYGKILEAAGEADRAEAVYRAGYEHDRKNPYLLHALAVRIGKRAAYADPEVEQYFQELSALPGQAENPYLWQARAEHARRRGRLAKAEDCFRQALELDPDNIPARVGYANLELHQGQGRNGEPYRQHAEQLLRKAREIDGRNVYALHSLGMVERERAKYGPSAQEHFHQAERYWQMIVRIDPYNIPALNALGVLKKDRGQLRQARDVLERGLEIDPENLHCLTAWGELWTSVYKDCGRQDAAEEATSAFATALDRDPQNAQALIGSARLLGLLSRYEEAEERLKQADTLYADRSDIRGYTCSVRGEIALAQGQDVRAEREFRSVLSETQKSVAVHTALARVLARRNLSEARRVLNQARRFEPSNVVIDNTLAQIEAAHGNTTEAQAAFEHALSTDEENGYTHFRYAEFLEDRGKFETAKSHFEHARTLGFTLTEMPTRKRRL